MSAAIDRELPATQAPIVPGYAFARGGQAVSSQTFASHAATVGDEFTAVCGAHAEDRAAAWLTTPGVADITWGHLYARANRAARALSSRLAPGDRVALLAANSVDWLIASYACALSGNPFVPMSPRSTSAEIAHVVRRARVRAVLLGPAAERGAVVAVAQGGADATVRWIATIAELETSGEMIGSPIEHRGVRGMGPDAEFLVQLTSGTTGAPKLAVLSHRAALGCALAYAAGTSSVAGDTWFNPLPLHHVGGSVSGALAALVTRGTYTVLDRFDPAVALRVLRDIGPTVVGMVPTMVIDLLASPTVSSEDFRSVRVIVGGATAVDPALIERVEKQLGVRFLVGYGQSEAPCMAMSFDTDPTEVRTATLGHPLPGRDYCIASERGVARIGEIGELCVRGALTMSGYLDENGSVRSPVDSEGWLRTGDLCSMDAAGVLRFHARTREVIIRGGSNIYPAEVEAAVSGHRGVAAVAVFGEPDERLGQVVAAAVVASGSPSQLDLVDLESHCRQVLSPSKVPVRWHVVTDMPRTSTGKIRKDALREELLFRPAADDPGTADTQSP